MRERDFGRTGRTVGEIGFGAWAIGADWGHVDAEAASGALNAALDAGMTFIDTADVYGDGRSEKLIAAVLKARGGPRPFVATKAGRRLPAQTVEGYSAENLSAWTDRSLANLQVDALDLVQLHCPPTALYRTPAVFERLDRLVEAGKVRAYGVSVETVEEAMAALSYPNVASVQIIFNMLRQKPLDAFFAAAREKRVAIIARVPLASGLLSGKFTRDTAFEASDHRRYNRNGEAFDVGETFSGVDYETGLAAVEKIRPLVAGDATMAQLALRWILMAEAVTVAIPGAKSVEQARANAKAADLPALPPAVMAEVKAIYDADIRAAVHPRW